MQCHSEATILSLENGALQGHLVTREAIDQGAYEASNVLFASPESGRRLVDATLRLID